MMRKKHFFKISTAKNKPAILRVIPPYSNEFIPKYSTGLFPKPITELYNPDMLHENYVTLIKECEKLFNSVKITPEQVALVELETRSQSSAKSWFLFHSGRITASVMKFTS
jgi:hypothetical protein